MILKSYELNSTKHIDKFLLLYGLNEGFKNEIINDLILKDFKARPIFPF